MNVEPLSQAEITNFTDNHKDWQYQDNSLQSIFTFHDFKQALGFMNEAGELAESLQHHPEWCNVYNRVNVTLKTHDAGDVVTTLDCQLATAISELVEKYRS